MSDVSGFFMKGAIIALIALLLFVAIGGAIYKSKYDSQISALQNDKAQMAQTIEVQKGVYEKLVATSQNLENDLSSKDAQIVALKKQVDDQKEQILTLTQVAVQWKTAYEAAVKGTQTTVPATPGSTDVRTKVEFEKDFGYIGAKGYTLTNPPEAWIHIQQNRPLKLSVAITQDAQKAWHSYVTSSEENVSADIQISGVNPFILDKKWYENIGVSVSAAVGTTDAGAGGLLGVGLTYKISKFEVGPSVYVTISNRVDKFFGASFIWHPFASE